MITWRKLNKSHQTRKSVYWWLYFFEVPGQLKLIYDDRNQISGYVGQEMRFGSKVPSGNILGWWKCSISWLGQCLYKCICQTHWPVHLGWRHFIACNSVFKIPMLYFYKCQEKAKLMYGDKSQKSGYYCGVGWDSGRGSIDWKGGRERKSS